MADPDKMSVPVDLSRVTSSGKTDDMNTTQVHAKPSKSTHHISSSDASNNQPDKSKSLGGLVEKNRAEVMDIIEDLRKNSSRIGQGLDEKSKCGSITCLSTNDLTSISADMINTSARNASKRKRIRSNSRTTPERKKQLSEFNTYDLRQLIIQVTPPNFCRDTTSNCTLKIQDILHGINEPVFSVKDVLFSDFLEYIKDDSAVRYDPELYSIAYYNPVGKTVTLSHQTE